MTSPDKKKYVMFLTEEQEKLLGNMLHDAAEDLREDDDPVNNRLADLLDSIEWKETEGNN